MTEIVSRAAAATLADLVFTVERHIKNDLTPVTAADVASEALIVEGVARLLPGVPVIAEESVAARAGTASRRAYVIVDPLDGTKEFLAGRDEFTVNLAIVTEGARSPASSLRRRKACLWRGVIGGKAERLRLKWGDGPHAPMSAARSARGQPRRGWWRRPRAAISTI